MLANLYFFGQEKKTLDSLFYRKNYDIILSGGTKDERENVCQF